VRGEIEKHIALDGEVNYQYKPSSLWLQTLQDIMLIASALTTNVCKQVDSCVILLLKVTG
jgi:hypothetical protein